MMKMTETKWFRNITAAVLLVIAIVALGWISMVILTVGKV